MGLTTGTTFPSGEVCMHDSQVVCLIFQTIKRIFFDFLLGVWENCCRYL